jgi:carbamoyl-phosphate synthase large subunit
VAPLNILVTGACGVTPRAIARSLGASSHFADARLVGADRGGNWYGFYEGLYERVYRVSEPSDPGYADLLAGICEREGIDVAVVGPEAEVSFWSGQEFPVPTLLPPPEFARIAISKGKLYEALQQTGLVPQHRIASRDDLIARRGLDLDGGPVWLRDYSEASSSGIGSIQVTEPEEAYAWAYLNPGIPSYMVAEHLPGRNIACTLLFREDELLKAGCYERLEYFMGHLAVSGVTGNINRGRLVNDERARALAEQAVRFVCGLTGERAHGLLTVDLREDRTGALKITEINVRHVAATSALAAGGANMAEAQVLATLGRLDEIGEPVPHFPDDNVILRDIDGEPIWLTDYRELAIGEHASGPKATLRSER